MSRALMRGLPHKQYGPYFIYDEVGELHIAMTPEDKAKIREEIDKRVKEKKKIANT